MRKHRHQRAKHRPIAPWPDDKPTPATVAAEARYVGSAEHKDYPSPTGHPALRSDASRCDPNLGYDLERSAQALRDAI